MVHGEAAGDGADGSDLASTEAQRSERGDETIAEAVGPGPDVAPVDPGPDAVPADPGPDVASADPGPDAARVDPEPADPAAPTATAAGARSSSGGPRAVPVQRSRAWHVLVPTVSLVAGLMFATSAATAEGTDLRAGRRVQLTELVTAQQQQVAAYTAEAQKLRAEVEAATARGAGGDSQVSALTAQAKSLEAPAGLSAVRGTALTVALDDAPRLADGSRPAGATPNDLVVHQQDVQATVNALWAGGAEAMTIQGVRIISTSAVRCVGNVLLLHDAVYPPPYVITAIGDPERMRTALDRSVEVDLFRQAAAAWGLGFTVSSGDARLPAYDGPLVLQYAKAAP